MWFEFGFERVKENEVVEGRGGGVGAGRVRGCFWFYVGEEWILFLDRIYLFSFEFRIVGIFRNMGLGLFFISNNNLVKF